MALENAQFIDAMRVFWGAAGPREPAEGALDKALGYPWERPGGSFVLRGEEVELLPGDDAEARDAIVESFTGERHPLLAFGGNAAPTWLAAKFAHFAEEGDRTVLVLSGTLHDFDVGPAASVSPIGYMPATLFASPGTSVPAALVWATPTQVTQLTWSEIPYRLGRLDGARFTLDAGEATVEDLFAYVHRLGSFCIDGSPVALAAVPAAGRTATAMTQQQLLDHVATLVLAPGADAGDLVQAVHDDMAAVNGGLAETVWPAALQLQASWTPYPAAT